MWKSSRPTTLYMVRDSIFENSPANTLNRKHQVILTRLRIGHTNYIHIYLIQKEEPKKCETCNTDITIKHILIDRPKYRDKRRQHKITNDRSQRSTQQKRSSYQIPSKIFKRYQFITNNLISICNVIHQYNYLGQLYKHCIVANNPQRWMQH